MSKAQGSNINNYIDNRLSCEFIKKEFNNLSQPKNIEKYFKNKFEYDIIIQKKYIDKIIVDKIIDVMVKTYCSNKETFRISEIKKPKEQVINQFMNMNSSHIEYIVECAMKNINSIKNMHQYLIYYLYKSVGKNGKI